MQSKEPKLRLPQISEIGLERFSLYTLNPNITFKCGDGVVCLVGANGIGKSTLLSAINYGLTGIVADPFRRFESIEEDYRFTLTYADKYFSGRILERDRKHASVSIQFRIGDYEYKLKRGLFESEELRELSIENQKTKKSEFDEKDKTHRELHQIYTEKLAEHVGLSTFEQFVFLQHYVFTFDERRKTLFWDQKILELVLYLTFGVDPNEAKRVDSMKREIESADSNVRNYNWEATKIQRKIIEIQREYKTTAAAKESYDSLADRHEKITSSLDEASKELEAVEKQLKDAMLRLADRSSRESALRNDYTKVFNRHLKKMPHISRHPLVTSSITENRCGLCGTSGGVAIKALKTKTNSTHCPICDSQLEQKEEKTSHIEELRRIDGELAKIKLAITESVQEIERIQTTEVEKRKKVDSFSNAADEFERKNSDTLAKLRLALEKPGGIDTLIASHKTQLEDRLKRKQEAFVRRNELKKELLTIQKNLEKEYAQAEKVFVPAFTELAHLFLGMDLEVRMDVSEAVGLNLVVEVKGTARRQAHMLSESQRFFLDIALRMAITQFISIKTAKGGLYIDTPEGSLDIAYEKRAGDMLSKFVEKGHPIIMTANINSSKLLLALAHNCRKERLTLCRMTEWTELSEVQIEEEDLFEDAYKQIEQAMTDGPPKK